MSAPIGVLIAPFRNRTDEDVQRLNRAKKRLLARGIVPIFLPDTLKDILCDDLPVQREEALWCSKQFLEGIGSCRNAYVYFFVVVGDAPTLSEGMKHDVAAARANGWPIEFLDV